MKNIFKQNFKKRYYKSKSFINFYFFAKKHSDSGLIIKFGKRGVGKSTDIAKFYLRLYKLHLRGKCPYTHFYTNQRIFFDNTGFFRYLDLNKFKFTDYIDPNMSEYNISTANKLIEKPPFFIERNSFIAIDELGIIAQNRDYKNFPPEWTNFTKLLRHFGIYMLAYSQNYDIDKSLRNGSNEMFIMRKFGNLTVSWKLKKDITCSKSDNDEQADQQIHDTVAFTFPMPFLNLKFTYIPFYTDLFNSFE